MEVDIKNIATTAIILLVEKEVITEDEYNKAIEKGYIGMSDFLEEKLNGIKQSK